MTKKTSEQLTYLDVTSSVQKDVITLDIPMDNTLSVKVIQAFTGLFIINPRLAKSQSQLYQIFRKLTSKQMVEIWSSSMVLLSMTSVRAPPSMYSITTQSSFGFLR